MSSLNEYGFYVSQLNVFITAIFLLAVLFAFSIKKLNTMPPVWVSVCLFSVVTIFFMLSKPLWYDEIFTAVTTRLSFANMMRVLASDVHPPLHYLLEFGVVRLFGSGEVALRMPSLLAGIGVLVVLYHLFLEWSDQHRARFGVLVVALLPITAHFSSEARYPIFLALVVLASYLAIIKNSKWQMILIPIAPLLHATGLIYAIALCIMAWVKNRKYAYVAFGLSLLYVPMMLVQSQDVANGFWLKLTTPIAVFMPTFFYLDSDVQLIGLSILVAVGVVYLRSSRNILGLMYGVPLFVFAISVLWHPVLLPRALLASSLLFVGMMAISEHGYLRVLALAFVVFSVASYKDYRVDYKALFAQCEHGSVLTTSTNMALVAMYYGEGLNTYSLAVDNAHQWLSEDAKHALGLYTPTLSSDCIVLQRSYATTFYEMLATTKYTKVSDLKVSDFLSYEVWHG